MQRAIYIRNTAAALVVALFTIIFSFVGSGTTVARAAAPISFDDTDVLDDLTSSDDFDITRYPYDSTGVLKHPEIFTVVEYCYSFKVNMRDNYGLYVYFYNPQNLDIQTDGYANKITLGVQWEEREDKTVVVTDYEKLDLRFCSKSKGDYTNLFYKFKVVDRKSDFDGKTIAERVNSNARRYDIAEVELLTKGEKNSTAYTIGGSYTFSGFAAGYGADREAESTLDCTAAKLETVELQVGSTVYRTASSSLGKGHQTQVSSVYFGVPNDVLRAYGKLQKIKAEWYEYLTRPVIVTSDKDAYDFLSENYVGKSIGETYDAKRRYSFYNEVQTVVGNSYTNRYSYCWNVKQAQGGPTFDGNTYDYYYSLFIDNLPYLFHSRGTAIADYSVSSEELTDYIYGYDKSHNNGYLPIKDGQISADLFETYVDNGRTVGYNCVDIDASETFDLMAYNSNHGFWDKVCDYGFLATLLGKTPSDDNVLGIEPIHEVKRNELYGNVETVASELFVDKADVDKIKERFNECELNNQTLFLFRFADTDYFSTDLMTCIINDNGVATGYADKSYAARETVFLGFDIIQLTFCKDDVYTVIPVVSNPIDVIGAITPPVRFEISKWWKTLLLLLAIVLVCVLLFPIISPLLGLLVKGVVWLITAPFKAIGKLFKRKKE